MTRILLILIGLALPLFTCSAGEDERVRLDFFMTPGCPGCERLEREILPEIEATCEGLYTLARHDMRDPETLPLLLAYAERCGVGLQGGVCMVVDHTRFLAGTGTISTGLLEEVNAALVRRQEPGWFCPPAPKPKNRQDLASSPLIRELTLPVIIVGGLLDGINPCAISTLIFFLSLLATAHVSRMTRLGMGLSFMGATFITYLLLGLGLLEAIHALPSLKALKKGVEITLVLGLLLLSLLSLRDALRFRRAGRAESVTLKLPPRVRQAIHTWMQGKLGAGGPLIGGFLAGAGATLLESLCTGQGYLPVLVYLLKQGVDPARTRALLLLYNLLFILPLGGVLLLFHWGTTLPALIQASRHHLPLTKVLTALFLLVMALLLLWL